MNSEVLSKTLFISPVGLENHRKRTKNLDFQVVHTVK